MRDLQTERQNSAGRPHAVPPQCFTSAKGRRCAGTALGSSVGSQRHPWVPSEGRFCAPTAADEAGARRAQSLCHKQCIPSHCHRLPRVSILVFSRFPNPCVAVAAGGAAAFLSPPVAPCAIVPCPRAAGGLSLLSTQRQCCGCCREPHAVPTALHSRWVPGSLWAFHQAATKRVAVSALLSLTLSGFQR